MKKCLFMVLCGLLILVMALIGTVPFLISTICVLLIHIRWVSVVAALTISATITVVSYFNPEAFRFFGWDFRIHDSIYVMEVHPLISNVGKNLVFTYLCVLTVANLKDGYCEARGIGSPGGTTTR